MVDQDMDGGAGSHEPPPAPVRQTQPSPVSVANVAPLKNPAAFGDALDFEITFESTRALPGDLEWSVVYVGSADNSDMDQTLADVEVDPPDTPPSPTRRRIAPEEKGSRA